MEEFEYEREEEEEKTFLLPPYYLVEYLDGCGDKHLATVKDKNYITFLEKNYSVINKRFIESNDAEIDFL